MIRRMKNLKSLIFGDVSLGKSGAVSLCDALLESGKRARAIFLSIYIHLYVHMYMVHVKAGVLSPPVAPCLLPGAPLEVLALNSNELSGGKPMDSICAFLSQGKHRLRVLNLSENELRKTGIAKLAACIAARPAEGQWRLDTISVDYCEVSRLPMLFSMIPLA